MVAVYTHVNRCLYANARCRAMGARQCIVFVREPGADNCWPNVRLRGQLPTWYPLIEAA